MYTHLLEEITTNKKMNIPQWLLSSQNNGNISLTIKGVVVLLIVFVLSHYGITVDKGQIIDIVNQFALLAGGAMAFYGSARKVINAYKKP